MRLKSLNALRVVVFIDPFFTSRLMRPGKTKQARKRVLKSRLRKSRQKRVLKSSLGRSKRVLKQEVCLVASKARVPAEKTKSPCSHVLTKVMLGEVHVVMGGDHRRLWLLAHRRVVDALAGKETCTISYSSWRFSGNKGFRWDSRL